MKKFEVNFTSREVQKSGIIKSAKQILTLTLLFLFIAGNWSCAAKKRIDEEKIIYQGNKTIPLNILEEAKIALSHYPELEDVEIEFI